MARAKPADALIVSIELPLAAKQNGPHQLFGTLALWGLLAMAYAGDWWEEQATRRAWSDGPTGCGERLGRSQCPAG